MSRRFPSTYVFGEGRESVVIVPGSVAYRLMLRPELQRLLSVEKDTETGDVLLAFGRAAQNFARESSPRGTGPATDAEQPQGSSCWFGVGEAAGRLGVSLRAVRLAISRNRLPAEQVEGRWRIRAADVEIYAEDRRHGD